MIAAEITMQFAIKDVTMAMEKPMRTCDVCGASFVPGRATQKRCGPECAKEHRRRYAREAARDKGRIRYPHPAVCKACGKVFQKKSKTHLVCTKNGACGAQPRYAPKCRQIDWDYREPGWHTFYGALRAIKGAGIDRIDLSSAAGFDARTRLYCLRGCWTWPMLAQVAWVLNVEPEALKGGEVDLSRGIVRRWDGAQRYRLSRLRHEMQTQRLTYFWLAGRVGVPRETLCKYGAGMLAPHHHARLIAEVLGVGFNGWEVAWWWGCGELLGGGLPAGEMP